MSSEILQRNPTSTGNRQVHTWASWVKLNKNSAVTNTIYYCASSGGNEFKIQISNGRISTNDYSASAYQYAYNTSRLLRDYGNWFHLMLAVDTTQTREDDRFKIYVNGVLYNGSYETENTNGGQNYLTRANTPGNICTIGQNTAGGANYDANCQLTDVFMVDGQALTPDVFGFHKDGDGYMSSGSTQATDFKPGQWSPHSPTKIKKDINRRGGFGVNGFYLPMNDSSNPGADFHCAPNSIIKLKGEDLPQPRNGAPTTSDAYVSQLRSDPFAANIVLAVPGISGGQGSGFGDYSADIRGSGTNKTILTTNSPTISSDASLYYGSSIKLVRASAQDVYTTGINETIGTGDFTLEGWFRFDSRGEDINAFNLYSGSSRKFFLQMRVSNAASDFHTRIGVSQNQYNSANIGWSNAHIGNWYHVATVMDSGTFSIFLNGVCVGVHNNVSENVGAVNTLRIGYMVGDGTKYLDGYFQDFRFYNIAKYKGGFDVPKPYTPVGIEAFRTTTDTCKNNFATLNPIDNNSGVLSNGNLTYGDAGSDGWNNSRATIGASSGKWYWEMRVDAFNQVICASVAGPAGNDSTNGARLGQLPGQNDDAGVTYYDNGRLYHADSQTGGQVSWGAAYGAGDVIGIALDMDDSGGKVWFSKNGSWQASGNPSTGANAARSDLKTYADTYFPISGTYFANTTQTFNFGQNPSFSGQVTAGTNADGNGKGLFKYAPPSGFLALCEDNLPTPAIADPGDQFKTVLWTGDGNSGRGITGVGFQPDFVWIKRRNGASDHVLQDSVRGFGSATKLASSSTYAENTIDGLYTDPKWGYVNSTSNNGFSLAVSTNGDQVNISGSPYVAWCWKAGGAAVSNTDGTITTQVSANQTAGFSIVSYTGTGANATVGHGLNKTPKFIITKQRTTAGHHWRTYHSSIGATKSVYLNLTNAETAVDAGFMNSTEPTTSVFSIGTDTNINENTQAHIAYCWAEIEGYSKFGSYVGNGNTDGPFIYCGFKPAFVIMKRTSSTGNWVIHDNARNPTNPAKGYLLSNSSGTEQTSNDILDLCSNGFKIRNSWTDINSGTHIFMAFAESPFQTANAK